MKYCKIYIENMQKILLENTLRGHVVSNEPQNVFSYFSLFFEIRCLKIFLKKNHQKDSSYQV